MPHPFPNRPVPSVCLPRRRAGCKAASLAVATALAGLAGAIDRDWSNAAGGSAVNPANWSPIGIPAAGDTLRFPIIGAYPVAFTPGVATSSGIEIEGSSLDLSIAGLHLTGPVRLGTGATPLTVELSGGTLLATGAVEIGASDDAILRVVAPAVLSASAASGDAIIVGAAGDGMLSLRPGAQATTAASVVVGRDAGSLGNLDLTEPALLRVLGAGADLDVARSGNGFLDQNGGLIEIANDVRIGALGGSNGVISVEGFGSEGLMQVGGDLLIGANGELLQASGIGRLHVGDDGRVEVDGVVRVGQDGPGHGSGRLELQGGTLRATSLVAAGGDASFLDLEEGELIIDGGIFAPAIEGSFSLANRSDRSMTLRLRNGASFAHGAVATVASVDGAVGLLDVTGGATATVQQLHLGTVSGSDGNLVVGGSGSIVTVSSIAIIGDAGIGDCLIFDGGHLAAGTIFIAVGAESQGGTHLINGGSIAAFACYVGATLGGDGGTGQLTFAGGSGAEIDTLLRVGSQGGVKVGETSEIDARRIEVAGLLRLEDGGSVAATTKVFVEAGGRLEGTGTVSAAERVAIDGTLSPGVASTGPFAAPGLLAIDGELAMEPGTLAVFDIFGTADDEIDRVDATGAMITGGVLEIHFRGGFAPQPGQNFTLMSSPARSGGFDALDLPTIPGLRLEVVETDERVALVIGCAADVDRDGTIGFGDLVSVLASWGTCGATCPADVDGDGVVGFADLVAVLAAWGPC